MPLTLYTAPSNSSSLANEMLFVIFEGTKAYDEVTYPDYKYVLDIYVASVLVGRQKVRPRPDNRLGIFDVSVVLRDYVTYGLSISSSKVDYDSSISYQVKLGEEYNGTTYTNLVTDSTRTAFKTYAKRPFTTSVIIANGMASNMPRIRNYHNDQAWMLFPIYSSSTPIPDSKIDLKDSTGSTLSTQSISNSDYSAGKIRQINFGQVFANNVEYINFYGGGVPITKVNLLCAEKYPAYTFAWLNPYGGYDSQSFGLVSKKTIEIERKDFSRLNYEFNVSGVVSYDANSVFYGSKRGFAATAKTKMLFTSHLLSDDEYTWLSEFFSSPDVYLYDTDKSKFMPVTITDTTYEYRTYKNSRLTPLQFNVEFSDQNNSQFL